MGRDFTDDIDDCCEAMLGHTNWGFMDTELDKDVTYKLRKDPKIKYVVVFYKDSYEDCLDEEVCVEPYGNTGSDVDYFHPKARTTKNGKDV